MAKFMLTVSNGADDHNIPFEGNEFSTMMTLWMEMTKDATHFDRVCCAVLDNEGAYFTFADSNVVRAANKLVAPNFSGFRQ